MRKTVDQWFNEYSVSHRNAINKLIHFICVPGIYLVVLALFATLPQPDWLAGFPFFHWGTVVALFFMLFYLLLSPALAKGLGMFTLICLIAIAVYQHTVDFPLWIAAGIAFIIFWIMQFVGHHIEGKKPSFLKDLQFLLIGPAWIMGFIYRLLRIPYH